jgi:hypothetical protein
MDTKVFRQWVFQNKFLPILLCFLYCAVTDFGQLLGCLQHCLLNPPPSFSLSVCLSALNNSKTDKPILMKFYFGQFCERKKTLQLFLCVLYRTVLTVSLHKRINTFWNSRHLPRFPGLVLFQFLP